MGALRAQAPHHPTAFSGTALGQQRAQRLELAALRLGQRGREVLELQQIDVEVAAGASDLLQPAELGPEAAQLVGREHGLQLALQRPRPAHGDAQVVQELAVDVGQRPGQVGLDDLRQPGEDRDRGGVGTLRAVQGDREFDDTPPGVPPALLTASSASDSPAAARPSSLSTTRCTCASALS